MPVLPLVGSIKIVFPGEILPAFSAASIMAKPMRSLTLDAGFWLSSLATTVAGNPAATRFSRTRGVWPINSVTFAAMRAMMISFFRGLGPGSLVKRILELALRGTVQLVRDLNARNQAHEGIGAGTRTVLATSMHVNSVDPTPSRRQ